MVATEKMLLSGCSCSPVVLAFASTQSDRSLPNFISKSANLRHRLTVSLPRNSLGAPDDCSHCLVDCKHIQSTSSISAILELKAIINVFVCNVSAS